MNFGTLKYTAVNVAKRNKLRNAWNQPIFWPLGVLVLLSVILILPLIIAFHKKEKQPADRMHIP